MTRDLHIRKVMNGFVVKVGCKEIVFGPSSDLLAAVGNYLAAPDKVETEWRRNYGMDDDPIQADNASTIAFIPGPPLTLGQYQAPNQLVDPKW
jgi:hypothetical protein